MKCKAKRNDGKRCNTNAMDNGYCYFHNPDISDEEKKRATKRGGEANKIIKVNGNFPGVKIHTAKDVTVLLSKLINAVLQNEVDLRIATGLTYIANVMLKAFEQAELEDKIESIEALVNKLNRKGGKID